MEIHHSLGDLDNIKSHLQEVVVFRMFLLFKRNYLRIYLQFHIQPIVYQNLVLMKMIVILI